LYVVAVAAGCALGLSTKRRFVHLAVGTALLLWSNGLTFVELFVVGPR
jgi:hypothetical protein